MKYTDDEFEGNCRVTVSPNEVRVWVCDANGCRFRIKAVGHVTRVNRNAPFDINVIADDKG